MVKEKKLTDEGVEDIEKIEGVDEIEKIEYTKEPIEPPKEQTEPIKKLDFYKHPEVKEEPKITKQEVKEIIKQANKDPEAKRVGARVMRKSTYTMIWATIGVLVLLLIWSNTVFSLKDFSPEVNINNDHKIETTIPTTNNNNFTINNENNIEISKDVINNMTKEIADKVILKLNLTNST